MRVLVVMFALFLVGGGTRLTDSGLSITEWKPIHGVIPPLNDAQWQEELEKYRQIPEYQQINKGMSLEAFKSIFWWEWAHRLIARLVGVVMAVPLAFFWLTGRLRAISNRNCLACWRLAAFRDLSAGGW
jgi:cytochrome c oxidase assembly protein subunit 15